MARATSCESGIEWCQNSVENAGEGRQKCTFCRLAPDNEHVSGQYWRPINRLMRHPVLKQEQRDAARGRAQAAHQRRLTRDKGKQRVLRRAGKAEQTTERNIIVATKNSGRSNRDGDHIAAGQITLDTKLQSTRDNPVVLLSELAKVREDAARAGNVIGGLVLRNRSGVGVIVFSEADFARSILSRL